MELNTSGIIFISVAWGLILLLMTYCFIKVFKSEKSK